mmetsp:Transcript_17990/g.36764  ORF Transcript_17990/g.36764 Transcript_17990/m.36764 type:complete len:413 (-) Transcript_17990:50-1288(-)
MSNNSAMSLMWSRQRRTRRNQSNIMSLSSSKMLTASGACLISSAWFCQGFSINNSNMIYGRTQFSQPTISRNEHVARHRLQPLHVFAPPGSGYVGPDPDYEDDPFLSPSDIKQISPPAFPDTYEPMLEYPGTMRPGRTPENMPYHDLPGLGIDDPNPVPWPHFQEIEWHHMWDPPHEQAVAMEEFIENEGRWASVEEEAEMRMGMRRGVRERREMEEMGKLGGGSGDNAMVIMDDDEEEEGDVPSMMGLGDGVEALLGKRDEVGKSDGRSKKLEEDEDDYEGDEEDDDGADFLLDLGLGGNMDDDEDSSAKNKKPSAKKQVPKMKAQDEEEDHVDAELDFDEDDDDDLNLDFELGFDLDDDDETSYDLDDDDEDDDADFNDDDDELTIEELNARDDGGDDDDFDDGGFDYDD